MSDRPTPRARRTNVLIPVKALFDAKLRLRNEFADADRQRLARAMANHVIAAAGDLRVSVVCDDDEIAAWATERGAQPILRPGLGLNGAVNDAVATLARRGVDERGADRRGVDEVIVAHADLPFAHDLARLGGFDGVTLVPDRHGDGTNVCCVPALSGFVFNYGPGSFHAHIAEAKRLGCRLRVIHDVRLGWDIDRAEDLEAPPHLAGELAALTRQGNQQGDQRGNQQGDQR